MTGISLYKLSPGTVALTSARPVEVLAAEDYVVVLDSAAAAHAITPDPTLLSKLDRRGGNLTCEVKGDRVLLAGQAITFMVAEIEF
jgi:hypothetical protein